MIKWKITGGCDTAWGLPRLFFLLENSGRLRLPDGSHCLRKKPDCNDSGMAGDTTIPFKLFRIACIAFKCFYGTLYHGETTNTIQGILSGLNAMLERLRLPEETGRLNAGKSGRMKNLGTIRIHWKIHFKLFYSANGISISL